MCWKLKSAYPEMQHARFNCISSSNLSYAILTIPLIHLLHPFWGLKSNGCLNFYFDIFRHKANWDCERWSKCLGVTSPVKYVLLLSLWTERVICRWIKITKTRGESRENDNWQLSLCFVFFFFSVFSVVSDDWNLNTPRTYQ